MNTLNKMALDLLKSEIRSHEIEILQIEQDIRNDCFYGTDLKTLLNQKLEHQNRLKKIKSSSYHKEFLAAFKDTNTSFYELCLM